MECSENWTKAETLLLISEYKKFPILYMDSHPDYNKTSKRHDAYQTIANMLLDVRPGLTVAQVQKKINSLNRQMTLERRKLAVAHRNGKASEYKPTLWCFFELYFVLKKNGGKQLANESSSSPEKDDDLNKQCPKESSNPESDTKSKIDDSCVKMLEMCAKKSIILMSALLEKSKTESSKEDIFCSMICAELNEIDDEDIYDNVTLEIWRVIRQAKEKDRLLFERQQLGKKLSLFS